MNIMLLAINGKVIKAVGDVTYTYMHMYMYM